MDNETVQKDMSVAVPPTTPNMPKSAPFAANLPKGSSDDPKTVSDLANSAAPGDRNSVFANLVGADSDIAGLVAYSIYKQNKLDWLTAFQKAKSRPPNDDELASYIIGEGTPRRLTTYRHLAEATLAGSGPEVTAGGGSGKGGQGLYRRVGASERAALTTGLLATYALIAVLFLVGFLLAAHYTMTSR